MQLIDMIFGEIRQMFEFVEPVEVNIMRGSQSGSSSDHFALPDLLNGSFDDALLEVPGRGQLNFDLFVQELENVGVSVKAQDRWGVGRYIVM